MKDLTVREAIKQLLDFNPDAKLSVVHDGMPIKIESFSWALRGCGDSDSGEREILKEKANATYVYIDCDKSEHL